MNTLTNSKRGFTIIEVVLVLAIAGLIFLIVFLAVPALQRSQRDTARRSDVGRAIAAVQQYQSNNKGALPTLNAAFITAYLTNGGASFEDPSTGSYTFQATAAAAPPATVAQGTILYRTGVTCPVTGSPNFVGGGGRNIAMVMGMETGGVYCQSI